MACSNVKVDTIWLLKNTYQFDMTVLL